jgi:hypothetical protein
MHAKNTPDKLPLLNFTGLRACSIFNVQNMSEKVEDLPLLDLFRRCGRPCTVWLLSWLASVRISALVLLINSTSEALMQALLFKSSLSHHAHIATRTSEQAKPRPWLAPVMTHTRPSRRRSRMLYYCTSKHKLLSSHKATYRNL